MKTIEELRNSKDVWVEASDLSALCEFGLMLVLDRVRHHGVDLRSVVEAGCALGSVFLSCCGGESCLLS
ncbi:hypothetical protein Droror1_Dr00005202 [Drosera rotundifolia]